MSHSHKMAARLVELLFILAPPELLRCQTLKITGMRVSRLYVSLFNWAWLHWSAGRRRDSGRPKRLSSAM